MADDQEDREALEPLREAARAREALAIAAGFAAARAAADALRAAGWKLDDSDVLVVASATWPADEVFLYRFCTRHRATSPDSARVLLAALDELRAHVARVAGGEPAG